MSENHTMSQIRRTLHTVCSRVLKPMICRALHPMCSQLPNISRSITTSAPRLVLTLSLMLASMGAWATDYVFVYNGGYLGVNAAGTGIENVTTFDPARCVWTCVYNNAESTLDGTSRALRITYNGNTRYLNGSTTAGAAPTLSNTAQNVWRANGTYVLYRSGIISYYLYYRGNSWRTSSTGRANNNNGYQSNNGGTDYRGTLTAITYTNQVAGGTLGKPTVSYSSYSGTGIQLAHTNVTGKSIPAHSTFVVGGTTYYRYNNQYYTSTDVFSTTIAENAVSYSWNVTSSNANVSDEGVVTPNNNNTTNVTVRVTANHTNPTISQASDNYTINVSSTAAETTYTGGLNAVTPANNSITYNANTGITLDSPARKKNTTAAYQTYTASGNTFYRVNNNFQAAAPTASSTDVTLNGYNWTLTAGASNAQLASTTGTTNTLTYKTASQSGVTATVSVTANYAEGGNVTKTANVTLRKVEKCTTPTITLGSNGKVTITAGPGETIYYKTDDSYNNNGTYTVYTGALDVTGRTRIWAYSTRNGYLDSDATSIIVADPYNVVPATYDGINLLVDDTYNLTYTLNGPTAGEVVYNRVVYASADPTVATVNQSGKITALKAGTTKVTLTGYKLDGTALTPVEVNVTVRNPYNDPTSMAVNSTNQTLNQGETWQIVATAYGTEPVYQKFKYEVTGAGGIVSVDESGLVKALSQGNTQITVTAYNYGDVLSAQTQTINITVQRLTSIDGKTCIYDLREITNAAGSYILMDDISASNGLNITFTGTFDGDYHTISGLNSALFSSISGGTVKNVRLDNVSISSGDANGHVGAIANTATGSTRIYNCGVLSTDDNSSITGSGSVGSIVGQITAGVYVVNCYSYAEVSGGEYAAGIVGRVYAEDPYAGRTFRITNNTANNRYLSDPDGTLRLKDAPSSWVLESNGGSFYLKNAQTNRYICTGTNGWNSTMDTSKANAISFTIVDHGDVYQISCTNGSLGSDATADGSNVWRDKGYPNNNTQWTIRDAATNQLLVFASGAVVTNCMFYGDMTDGTNRSPVYGGYHVDNIQKPNEYNYYRSKANLTYTAYNEQGAIDKDEFLTRFPFYRHIMNTHRELAAIKLFGNRTDAYVNEIGHWVLDTKVAPYPIIEKWETNTKRTTVDIAANLPLTSEAYAGKLLTEMGSGGYLNVNVIIDGSSRNVRLPITDMDTLRYDFTWGKVVLPFANEFDGWTRDYSKVITGWKITSITGGTTGTLTNYNFADRDCTAKDLYSNSGYIFAQGGNYIVPYGVTAITIEANFANAYYLSDATYDIGYNENYGGATGLNGNVPTTYHGQTVYTSLATLMGQLTEGKYNPHEQAIVLVGNYHYNQGVVGTVFPDNNTKGLTIMSVDEDNNQEPDYGWYSYHTSDRTNTPSLRFDFVPNIGIGMAARVKGSTPYPTIGIWHSKAWFELTETCVSFMSECEIDDGDFSNTVNINNRWIANSGYFIQIVRAHGNAADRLAYLQIGGNAYVEQLYPGPHMAQGYQITLCPINVTGGEIKECFMTGKGSGTPNATGQNIYFWCAGGRIHKYLSAYMVKPSTAGVNVVAKVDHARIYRFFGGGTSPTARVTGNINVTMNNSLVDFYCGGPEFGDMENGTTVTTNATGTTFGEFYGAGFGGTSTTWVQRTDNGVTFNSDVYTYPSDWTNYTDSYLQYDNSKGGWGSNYDFEYIMYSGGNGQGVGRFYTGYSDFSLAQTGNVTSNLTDCTVLNNFYGGGCQGTVAGNATSTLTSCHIDGNAFAGGYKAPETMVEIYSNIKPTYPIYTRETGIFTFYDKGSHETWRWVEGGTAGTKHDDTKTFETGISFANLGAVTGNATITVEGDTYVAGMIEGQPNGGVFGGGNESPVRGETEVNISSTNTYTIANVYGGANKADVGNNTVVNVTSGTVGNVFGANNVSGTKANDVTININEATADRPVIINNNVYGGGNLADYTGNPVVNMQAGTVNGSVFGGGLSAEVDGDTDVNITGGTVVTAVYGGGALADVTGNTDVSLTGGTVGDVYGGGLGRLADDEHSIEAVAALVGGNTLVTLDGSIVTGQIFGANNLNGTPQGTTKVLVKNTTPREGQGDGEYDVAAVYGGGNLAAYIPSDANLATAVSEVYVEGCNNSIEYVYGGGNAAPSPATLVTIEGGFIKNVFGGGNGKTEEGAVTLNPGADVGYLDFTYDNEHAYGKGTAVTNIYGGIIASVFGGSNTKGNIRESAEVFLENGECPMDINEVYGAGNEAEMYGAGNLIIGCIPGLEQIFAGAKDADVYGDVSLTITNGKFGKVFGGNNRGGSLKGGITVNIEETGCAPVEIDELYGGGYEAAYSVYGYDNEGNAVENGDALYHDPVVNVRSFTKIGTIYGGGEGASAVVYGNPVVNIEQVKGKFAGKTVDGNVVPDELGSIDYIYGGGNAANVVGNTTVNIATDENTEFVSEDEDVTKSGGTWQPVKTVEGANIKYNVYGGGNAADVTGKTNVKVGRD